MIQYPLSSIFTNSVRLFDGFRILENLLSPEIPLTVFNSARQKKYTNLGRVLRQVRVVYGKTNIFVQTRIWKYDSIALFSKK